MKKFSAICLLSSFFFIGFFYSQDSDSILFSSSNFRQVTVNIHLITTQKNQKVPKQVLNEISTAFYDSKIVFNYILQDYSKSNFPTVLSSPSGNKITFTRQMRSMRDAFFKDAQDKNDNDYYIFFVGSFSDANTLKYALPNKHILFVKYSDSLNFSKTISSGLMRCRGVSVLSDTSSAAITNISELLTWKERLELRQSISFFQIYDDYEFIPTSNGLVAYYLWSEDKDGRILTASTNDFLKDLVRPFKRNNTLIYLKIENPLFWPIYRGDNWVFSPMHIIVLLLVIILLLILRKKVNNRILESRWYKRWMFRIFKVTMFLVSIGIVYGSFLLVNKYYSYRFLESYNYTMFNKYTSEQVVKGLDSTPELIKVSQKSNKTEAFINRGGKWVSELEKPVMYFELIEGKNGKAALYFRKSSNTISINGKSYTSFNHYIVVNRKSEAGALISQSVYDYQGKKLSTKNLSQNPTKRILLFVNGYRPVTTSSDLEKTFAAIQSKGLEMPATSNYIYDNDRFAYWTPWKNINSLFENRIHPDDIYYADGHHSIATSNYLNVLSFTNSISFFPKRCKNLKNHTCSDVINITKNKVKSISLLPTKANTNGFNVRRMNGKIAGYNLLQLLNNVPNASKNDTLYIVAHSMGYAYSLGISDVLSKNINFGGFYILAPENACSGKVKLNQWAEVRQYGAKLTGDNVDPMCLQDGIAPQSNAKGLLPNNIIHFPKELDAFRGFSGSHFVGNYTWIFDIPQGKKGAVSAN